MKEDPLAADTLRQQRRILVLGLPDDSVTLDVAEVRGRREEDRRPAGADRVLHDE